MKKLFLLYFILLVGCMNTENSYQMRRNISQALLGASNQMQQMQQQRLALYQAAPLRFNNNNMHCSTQYSGNMAYTNCN